MKYKIKPKIRPKNIQQISALYRQTRIRVEEAYEDHAECLNRDSEGRLHQALMALNDLLCSAEKIGYKYDKVVGGFRTKKKYEGMFVTKEERRKKDAQSD